jgi:hypothetical protein
MEQTDFAGMNPYLHKHYKDDEYMGLPPVCSWCKKEHKKSDGRQYIITKYGQKK